MRAEPQWLDAQTQLLSDAKMRQRFRAEPAKVAVEFGLSGRESDIDIEGIEEQAQTLLRKRFHAAAKYLPRTTKLLGSRALSVFVKLRGSEWPEGHRRHLRDAAAFAEALMQARCPDVCPVESACLQFILRPVAARIVFVQKMPVKGRESPGLLILARWRRRVIGLKLFLG